MLDIRHHIFYIKILCYHADTVIHTKTLVLHTPCYTSYPPSTTHQPHNTTKTNNNQNQTNTINGQHCSRKQNTTRTHTYTHTPTEIQKIYFICNPLVTYESANDCKSNFLKLIVDTCEYFGVLYFFRIALCLH